MRATARRVGATVATERRSRRTVGTGVATARSTAGRSARAATGAAARARRVGATGAASISTGGAARTADGAITLAARVTRRALTTGEAAIWTRSCESWGTTARATARRAP